MEADLVQVVITDHLVVVLFDVGGVGAHSLQVSLGHVMSILH